MSTEQQTGFPAIFPPGGLLRNDENPQYQLGMLAMDIYGNFYRYIKANEALAVGQVVTAVAKAAWDSGIAVDGAVTAADTLIHIDTVTTAMTANQYAGYYVSQATAAGLGRGHRILGHDAIGASSEGDIFLDDVAGEAFADDAALYIFHPYLMELVDGDTEMIQGVALSTITADYYGFVQVGGHCRRVAVGSGTSAAIVLNEPLVPVAATPGSCQGFAGNTEADLVEVALSPLIALQAVNANTTGYVEAKFSRLV